jgi:hypothetical protein
MRHHWNQSFAKYSEYLIIQNSRSTILVPSADDAFHALELNAAHFMLLFPATDYSFSRLYRRTPVRQ